MLITFLLHLWRDRRGQDLIEYALITGFLCVSIAFVLPWAVVDPALQLMSAIGLRMGSVTIR